MIKILILASLVVIAAIVFSKFSYKIGLPSLLIFLALGMLLGTDGIGGLEFSNFTLAEQICSIGLVFIMFYGGFGMNLKIARPVIPEALLLSSLGTVGTALVTGIIVYLVLGFSFAESFLVGSVIASTDAASVFAILRQKKINLKGGLASMLEMESGSNDPFAYMLTIVALTLVGGSAQGGVVLSLVVKQIFFGLLFGVAIAWASRKILENLTFSDETYDSLFLVAIALLSYALPSAFDGNGYLAVYVAGVLIGNTPISNKSSIVHFFDGLTQLTQIIIFFIFGLLSYPSRLPENFLIALIVFLIMTFVSRPLATAPILALFKRSPQEMTFISTAGLRGAASLVFAIVALSTLSSAGTPISYDLYHVVFWIVLFSIALQGTVLSPVAKALGLVDNKQSVMKTFNDYIDETEFTTIEITVEEGSSLDGSALCETQLPHGGLAVLIRRGDEDVLPQGSTILEAGDRIVMTVPSYRSTATDFELTEISLYNNHPWINKLVKDIGLSPNALIVIIKRGDGQTIVPNGNTKLLNNDTLVISGDVPNKQTEVVD